MHQACFLLTYAAGGGPWPGAVSLAQSDAGTLEVKIWQASCTTGRIEVVITYVLDEKAIFWRGQCWTVYHWDKRRKDKKKCCEILTFILLLTHKDTQHHCEWASCCSHELWWGNHWLIPPGMGGVLKILELDSWYVSEYPETNLTILWNTVIHLHLHCCYAASLLATNSHISYFMKSLFIVFHIITTSECLKLYYFQVLPWSGLSASIDLFRRAQVCTWKESF